MGKTKTMLVAAGTVGDKEDALVLEAEAVASLIMDGKGSGGVIVVDGRSPEDAGVRASGMARGVARMKMGGNSYSNAWTFPDDGKCHLLGPLLRKGSTFIRPAVQK